MYEAVLLDFYGTVVHEDEVVIEQIYACVAGSATVEVTPSEVGRHWWSVLSAALAHSHGDDFRLQRHLELAALTDTITRLGATSDASGLCGPLFAHWERPPIFVDATLFLGELARLARPVVVVSNIDRADIEQALDHHGLVFERVITSDDVCSYKPRPELFLAGLEALGCPRSQVLHVGDSLSSDVAGAHRLGIPVAWVNRTGRAAPSTGHAPTHEVTDLRQLLPLLS